MRRRDFLANALGIGVVGVASGPLGLLPRAASASTTRPAVAPVLTPDAAKDRTLVLLTLYGGNDGLNTVIPYTDPVYLSSRTNIENAVDKLLPLGDDLALNPSLGGFKTLWDAGQLAIVRGVGYPNPSLSHFQSMAIWQSASPSGDQPTGWLGRWLDRTKPDPLRACSIGPNLPPAMSGKEQRATAVQDSTSGGSQLPGEDPQILAVYRELQRPGPGRDGLGNAIAGSARSMLQTSKTFAGALDTEPPPVLPRGVEDGDVGTQLDVVSSLIRADLPTQAYAVTQGGYDTHSGELYTQSQLLGQLGTAVETFFASLAGHPRGAGTTLVIYTEFGRRVASNGSAGTDHGTANNVFVVGPSVHGGFYGDQPSLTSLDDNGNLIHNVDFRSIYATVLENVIGIESKPFLGRSFPTIGFV